MKSGQRDDALKCSHCDQGVRVESIVDTKSFGEVVILRCVACRSTTTGKRKTL